MKKNEEIKPSDLRKEYKVKSPTTWADWIRPLVEKKLVRPYAKLYSKREAQAIRSLLG